MARVGTQADGEGGVNVAHIIRSPGGIESHLNRSQSLLDTLFRRVRADYFPRWDKDCKWRALFGTDHECRLSTGYCDSKARSLFFCEPEFLRMPNAGRVALVIHEICHDVGAAGHNRRWARRMTSAAARAEALGADDVAKLLRGDVMSYCRAGVNARYDAESVEEYALELASEIPASCRRTEGHVEIAKYFGVSTRKLTRDFESILAAAWSVHRQPSSTGMSVG